RCGARGARRRGSGQMTARRGVLAMDALGLPLMLPPALPRWSPSRPALEAAPERAHLAVSQQERNLGDGQPAFSDELQREAASRRLHEVPVARPALTQASLQRPR